MIAMALACEPKLLIADEATTALDVGGSSRSPRLPAAIASASRYYVDMKQLLDTSGKLIAGLVGAEAAYVTPGQPRRWHWVRQRV